MEPHIAINTASKSEYGEEEQMYRFPNMLDGYDEKRMFGEKTHRSSEKQLRMPKVLSS